MRFSTSKFCALVLSIMIGQCVFSAKANAAVTKNADLFGKYKFTATLELTDDGEAYKDRLLSECEVTITKDPSNIYDAAINNLAGAPNAQKVSDIDFTANTITVNNPNTSTYYLWGQPLSIANANGDYPLGSAEGPGFEMVYTFDPETGNISVPDFTAVVCDFPNSSATVMAKFTNCKLTLIEREVLIADDISGDYHFTTEQLANEKSKFTYTECDITLASKNENHTEYTATIKFADGIGCTLDNVTFDGNEVAFNFKDAWLDADKTFAIVGKGAVMEGDFTFSHPSEDRLSLTSYWRFGTYGQNDEGETVFGLTQYYTQGVAVKASEAIDFAGVYKVKKTPSPVLTDWTYPSEFEIEVFQSTYTGNYLIKSFMGNDTYSLNNGGIPCEVDGNTLKIAVGQNRSLRKVSASEDHTEMVYDTFFDAAGLDATPVTLTINGDGTATIGDFVIMRTTKKYDASWNMTANSTPACLYIDDDDDTGISGVENDAVAGASDGIYTVSGVRVAGANANLSTLPTGLYIVKDGNRTVKIAR